MRAATLTWMTLRELWISFRFLGLLAMGLAGGLAAAAFAPQGADAPTLLAAGVGAACVVGAGLAGSAIAVERRRGRVAWLAVRSVPRSATLVAWFAGMALPLLAGLATSALLGWLVAGRDVTAVIDVPGYASVAVASASVALEAIALGMAAGCLLAPVPAGVAGVVAAAALVAAGLLPRVEPAVLPSAGVGLLASLATLERPLSDGLQATGLALAGTGLLLAVASAALSRADL